MGTGPAVIRKFILTEDCDFTLVPDAVILYSEIINGGSGDEVLELWIAVPLAPHLSAEPSTESTDLRQAPRTIYTNTTIYEDDQEVAPPYTDDEPEDEFYD